MKDLMLLSTPTFWSTRQAAVPTYLQVRVRVLPLMQLHVVRSANERLPAFHTNVIVNSSGYVSYVPPGKSLR